MSESKFEISKRSGIHAALAAMEGSWFGTTKTWFEADKLEDRSPTAGTIRPVLEGRFLLYEYDSRFKGKLVEGICIIGYDLANSKYQVAWVDSFHMSTGIMFSQSSPEEKLLSVLGSYGDPSMPEQWGWRTEIEMPNADSLVITAYNISPAGESVKATETVLGRVKSQDPQNK